MIEGKKPCCFWVYWLQCWLTSTCCLYIMSNYVIHYLSAQQNAYVILTKIKFSQLHDVIRWMKTYACVFGHWRACRFLNFINWINYLGAEVDYSATNFGASFFFYSVPLFFYCVVCSLLEYISWLVTNRCKLIFANGWSAKINLASQDQIDMCHAQMKRKTI